MLNAEELAFQGWHLTSEEAALLETKLLRTPDDEVARIHLIGYYFRNRTSHSKQRKAQHICWFLEHAPTHPILGAPSALVLPDDSGFSSVQLAWERNLEVHSGNAHVLMNAARFYLVSNREYSQKLGLRGRDLEPDNEDWIQHLVQTGYFKAPKKEKDGDYQR